MATARPRRALESAEPVAAPETPAVVRPRRAAEEPVAHRSFVKPLPRAWRLAVPVVAVTAVLAGAAFVAWPQTESVVAVPATQPTSQQPSADAVQDNEQDAASAVRPAPTPSASESAVAEGATAAERAAKQAAARSAAAKKAAAARQTALDKAVNELDVTGSRYATTELNLRTEASAKANVTKVVPSGTKLSVTDTVDDGFRLVAVDDKARWVSNEYLSKDKPKVEFSTGACSSGSAMESGLTSDAVKVHRAVCAKFPQVSSFGGVRAGDGGFHGSGRAVDCMISDSDVGWEIARWVRAHAKELGVSEVIYSQHIWTVQRSGEGWRSMSDRGSATANHYDHVHVSVYGSSATS